MDCPCCLTFFFIIKHITYMFQCTEIHSTIERCFHIVDSISLNSRRAYWLNNIYNQCEINMESITILVIYWYINILLSWSLSVYTYYNPQFSVCGAKNNSTWNYPYGNMSRVMWMYSFSSSYGTVITRFNTSVGTYGTVIFSFQIATQNTWRTRISGHQYQLFQWEMTVP